MRILSIRHSRKHLRYVPKGVHKRPCVFIKGQPTNPLCLGKNAERSNLGILYKTELASHGKVRIRDREV